MTDGKISFVGLAILCTLIASLQCCGAKAQTTEDKINWLTARETAPVKAYVREVKNTQELANALDKSSIKWSIDVDYLIVIAYTESVFRNVKGDNGRSWGEMQVGKQGRRVCKCSMETVETRIDCGACWLANGRDAKNNLDAGLKLYIGGVSKSLKALRKFNFKKWIIKKMKKVHRGY